MKMLILDPSKNNVGWATFNTKARTRRGAWKWGTWKPEGHSLEMRMTDLVQTIGMEIGEFDLLVTERPAFFSSERGQIAAHMNYTIDLAAISYFIAGWFHMDHRRHLAITANQWKGTVSKEITALRFFKRFPHVAPSSLTEHAIDAVMLGRFAIETFVVRMPQSLRGSSPELLLSLV